MTTDADIRAIFAAYGVPLATETETEVARLSRIVYQVNSGLRTLADVELWVRHIAAGTTPTAEELAAVGTTDVSVYGNVPGGTGGTGTVLNSIPEGDQAQVWLNSETGGYYLVYFVPGTSVPILYVGTQADFQSMFGPGQTITPNRTGTRAEFEAMGALFGGNANELSNLTENPFDAWVSMIEDQADVRPWLREADVLALIAEALLEGREVTEAEFQQTNWWRTHNEAQRQWLLLVEADPQEAQRLVSQNKLIIGEQLRLAGAGGVNPLAIDYMARQFTSGNWDSTYLQLQIRAVSDPASGVAVDQGIMDAVAGGEAGLGGDTTRAMEDRVRELVERWLGPAWGEWPQSQVDYWAGRLRNDPDAELELVEILKNGRNAVLPQYNPNATYEDIAGPWRSFWTQIWGSQPKETDNLWMQVLSLNDAAEAGKLLRREGLNRGIKTVVDDAASAVGTATNQNIRRAVEVG